MGPDDVLLLVEDDPNDVFFFENALARFDPTIPLRRLADGDAAQVWLDAWAARFGAAASRPALLVVLDVKLPLRSGLEVLRWMREKAALRAVPVILFTSSRDPVEVTCATSLGAEAYRVKPVDFTAYSEIVRQIGRRFLELARAPAPTAV